VLVYDKLYAENARRQPIVPSFIPQYRAGVRCLPATVATTVAAIIAGNTTVAGLISATPPLRTTPFLRLFLPMGAVIR